MRTVAATLIALAVTAAVLPAAAQTYGSRPPLDGGSAMAGRIERLEEQVAGLQGVVAAVETLAKNNAQGGNGYAAYGGGGASAEQIRQLSEQIADLTQRLERLESRGGVSPQAAPPRGDLGYGAAPASGFEDKQQLPPLGGAPAPGYSRPQPSAGAGLPPVAAPPRSYAANPVVPARYRFRRARRNPRPLAAARALFSIKPTAHSIAVSIRWPKPTSSSFSTNIPPIRLRGAHNIGSAKRPS